MREVTIEVVTRDHAHFSSIDYFWTANDPLRAALDFSVGEALKGALFRRTRRMTL